MEITAREFFCGAMGVSLGLKMYDHADWEQVTKVMEGVRQRYNIQPEEAKELLEQLNREFDKDADNHQ